MTEPTTLKELKEALDQVPESELDRPLRVVDVQDGTQYYVITSVLEEDDDGDESYTLGFDSTRTL